MSAGSFDVPGKDAACLAMVAHVHIVTLVALWKVSPDGASWYWLIICCLRSVDGRVYVWADASNGAIQPGDLLTTSDLRGHAMKVTDYEQAQGAILGKAMSELDGGTGLVLVLVTLQ